MTAPTPPDGQPTRKASARVAAITGAVIGLVLVGVLSFFAGRGSVENARPKPQQRIEVPEACDAALERAADAVAGFESIYDPSQEVDRFEDLMRLIDRGDRAAIRTHLVALITALNEAADNNEAFHDAATECARQRIGDARRGEGAGSRSQTRDDAGRRFES